MTNLMDAGRYYKGRTLAVVLDKGELPQQGKTEND